MDRHIEVMQYIESVCEADSEESAEAVAEGVRDGTQAIPQACNLPPRLVWRHVAIVDGTPFVWPRWPSSGHDKLHIIRGPHRTIDADMAEIIFTSPGPDAREIVFDGRCRFIDVAKRGSSDPGNSGGKDDHGGLDSDSHDTPDDEYEGSEKPQVQTNERGNQEHGEIDVYDATAAILDAWRDIAGYHVAVGQKTLQAMVRHIPFDVVSRVILPNRMQLLRMVRYHLVTPYRLLRGSSSIGFLDA